jgi:hypothetical protein
MLATSLMRARCTGGSAARGGAARASSIARPIAEQNMPVIWTFIKLNLAVRLDMPLSWFLNFLGLLSCFEI